MIREKLFYSTEYPMITFFKTLTVTKSGILPIHFVSAGTTCVPDQNSNLCSIPPKFYFAFKRALYLNLYVQAFALYVTFGSVSHCELVTRL